MSDEFMNQLGGTSYCDINREAASMFAARGGTTMSWWLYNNKALISRKLTYKTY